MRFVQNYRISANSRMSIAKKDMMIGPLNNTSPNPPPPNTPSLKVPAFIAPPKSAISNATNAEKNERETIVAFSFVLAQNATTRMEKHNGITPHPICNEKPPGIYSTYEVENPTRPPSNDKIKDIDPILHSKFLQQLEIEMRDTKRGKMKPTILIPKRDVFPLINQKMTSIFEDQSRMMKSFRIMPIFVIGTICKASNTNLCINDTRRPRISSQIHLDE
ncbi:MAG: hypothetical protein ACFFER_03525 [Candidatus Thorarchaeota archaeon]